ncbi:MAG TPA: flagellar motor switch protein FliG [Steroidobacteraceae bacterium]|jgi:flagellar motor switch protein FliG|nr:flagellar motor switch protein FliG [Steroidobacteraceae bacterium]
MNERADRRGEPARSGTDRAAILLLTLGESEAAQVLKHMGAKEVQRIGTAMAKLANVSRDEVHGVITDFTETVEGQTSVGVGADEFLRKVLIDALGQDKAASVIDRINIGRSTKGLEALKWMDSRQVAELIRLEHPQITAIVLAYLDPDQAAEVLALLPASTRADVVARVATLDGVQPSALTELDDIIEKQFAGKAGGKTSALGGAKAAANIINFLEPSQESALMEQIEKSDEALAARIQDLVFIFDNLVSLDDRSMQELLRQVPAEKLLLAMKGSEDGLKDKIFKNMSQRAAEMLRDDLEAKGPVRLSEVEAAQKEILQIARKLAEAGTIALGGKGEEYV